MEHCCYCHGPIHPEVHEKAHPLPNIPSIVSHADLSYCICQLSMTISDLRERLVVLELERLEP